MHRLCLCLYLSSRYPLVRPRVSASHVRLKVTVVTAVAERDVRAQPDSGVRAVEAWPGRDYAARTLGSVRSSRNACSVGRYSTTCLPSACSFPCSVPLPAFPFIFTRTVLRPLDDIFRVRALARARVRAQAFWILRPLSSCYMLHTSTPRSTMAFSELFLEPFVVQSMVGLMELDSIDRPVPLVSPWAIMTLHQRISVLSSRIDMRQWWLAYYPYFF